MSLKDALANAALIGGGGFAGALLRYAVSGLVHRRLPFTTFPFGTLAVNVSGCLLMGFLVGLAESRQMFGPGARAFALVGLLGGFTTFSTFGYETFAMMREGEHLRAASNVGAHVVLGLAAVWLGYAVTTTR